MKKKQCHSCQNEVERIEIQGKKKLANGEFCNYQICQGCSRKLSSINATNDRNARIKFLDLVIENASA